MLDYQTRPSLLLDYCTLETALKSVLGDLVNPPIKGAFKIFTYSGGGPWTSPGVNMAGHNCVNVLIQPPSGAGIKADVHVQGSSADGGYTDLFDPNAVQTGITTQTTVDVVAGTAYAAVYLTNMTGTPDPGQQWRIVITPYISPGQGRVQSTIKVNTLEAIQTLTGALEVSGACTIDATGSLSALGTGLAKLTLDHTGLKLFNSTGTQTGQLLDDGSGWLGSSSVFSWTTAGVVTLNGSAVAAGTLPGSATSFGNVPIINGLTLTNNAPSAGRITWSTFSLTYQGVTYTVNGDNSTTTQKFMYWNKAVSTTQLQKTPAAPSQAADQFIVIFNESGTGIPALFSNIVYADYISVGTLAAIQASTGSLSVSGACTIGTGGSLSSGQTGFNTGTGFWLDDNGGTPRFSIGDGASHYLTWDGTAMTVRGTINADAGYLGALSISGVLSIGTSGGLYQGTGTFAVPTTGLKMWNSGGIGTLATYSGGTLQVSLNTSGQLTAGAGNVTMDSNGVSILSPTAYSQPSSLSFTDSSKNLKAGIYQLFNSGSSNDTYIKGFASTNETTGILLQAFGATGKTSFVSIAATTGGSGPKPTLYIQNPNDPVFQFEVNGAAVATIDSGGNLTTTGYIRPPLSNGSRLFGIDANETGTTVANNATFTPFGSSAQAGLQALALVTAVGDNQSALFLLNGNVAPVLVSQTTAGIFTTTAGTANAVNVYEATNVITIENKRSSQEIRVLAIATRY